MLFWRVYGFSGFILRLYVYLKPKFIANFKKNLSQVALNCLDIYSVRHLLKCLHPSLGLDSERCERLNPARSLVLESGWFLVAFIFPLEYCWIFWWCNVIQTSHYESWYQDDIDCRCRWHDHRIFLVVHDFCFYIFRDQGVLSTCSLKTVKCLSPIQYIVVGLFK